MGFGYSALPGSAASFDAISGGTNTSAAMVVGNGASLSATGTGTITATAVAASGITGTLAASKGGTGLSTYAIGDIIYASATTPTLARLAAVATGSVLVSGGVNTAFAWSNSPTLITTAIGTAQTAGLTLSNTTAASSGNQQYSPGLVFSGQGWKTNSTAASQAVEFMLQAIPAQGAASPTGLLYLMSRVNGGAWGTSAMFGTDGYLNLPYGIKFQQSGQGVSYIQNADNFETSFLANNMNDCSDGWSYLMSRTWNSANYMHALDIYTMGSTTQPHIRIGIGSTSSTSLGASTIGAKLTVGNYGTSVGQLVLQSLRTAIASTNVVGGIEFATDTTGSTSTPQTADRTVAAIRAVAEATHAGDGTANGITTGDTGLYFYTMTGSTLALAAKFNAAGKAIFSGGISCPGAGNQSERFGSTATAAGADTVAIGYNASAAGQYSIVIGSGSPSSAGTGNVMVGYGTATNSRSNCVVIGSGATHNSGSYGGGVAIGQGAVCGDGSMALGQSTTATGYSVAIGLNGGCATTGFGSLGIAANVSYNASIGIFGTPAATNQLVVGSSYWGNFTDIYIGGGVTLASPPTTTYNATGGSGTDISGGSLRLAGGKPTGSGTGGQVIFATATAGSTGTTLRSLTDRAWFSGPGHLTFAEIGVDPTAASLTSGSNVLDRIAVYMKSDKLVFAYNLSGTVNYLTIPLDGSTATWTQGTTAP